MSFSKKIALFSTSVVTFFLFVVPSAFAQDGGAVAQQAANAVAELDKTAATGGMNLIAAALAIGIAACGCGLGQGRAAEGALQGIARNPSAYGKIFTPMIIALALIESLSIYALLVALLAIF